MVNNIFKKYIIVGSCITILLVALFSTCLQQYSSLPSIIAPVLFTIVSMLTVKVLSMKRFTAFLKFVNAMMLANICKLLVYIAFFVVSYFNIDSKPQLWAFVITLGLVYIVYSVMDTMSLLAISKEADPKPDNNSKS